MSTLARLAALALLAAAGAVRADIVLTGNHHTGDCDDSGSGCDAFTPKDPVSRNQMFNYPVNFTLSTTTTIDKVTLNGAVDLDSKFQVYIEARGTSPGSSSSRSGTLSGSTFDLVPDVVLVPGEYVILPDGGCSESNGSTFFYSCPGNKINDFGYSSITLESSQSSTSIMLNQRRHLGDNSDDDDDYDFSGSLTANGEFYPDPAEAVATSISFTLSANLRLTQIKFYRLRDINTESPNNATSPKVLVNGSQIGELTGEGDPFTLTLANSLLLTSGSHTLTVQSGVLSSQRDDFSWDDIVMVFADTTTSGTPGYFNAVDTGADVVTGSITTKEAGGPATLDLYALNGFGTGQNASYNGNATVEVLNAATSSGSIDVYGCDSGWSFAQSLGTVTFVAGKAQVPSTTTFLTAGLKEARIKVTDAATSAAGCSIDNFAIRPASFLVEPSQDSETSAGTASALTNVATSGLPRHKAGQPFTIVATARATGGATATAYTGTPDTPTAAAKSPATTSGTVTATWTAASAGVARTDTAKYSEVGAVTLSVTDTTWANVDADDTASSQRSFSGTADAGRFVPDHFKVTQGTLAPACAAGGFSYLGSALNWATPAVRLTAESAGNTTTMNYEGDFEKFPDAVAQPAFTALTGTIDTSNMAAPTINPWAAGTTTITLDPLKFVRALTGAFDAEIEARFAALAESDGIEPSGGGPIVLGSPTAGGGIAFTGNAKSQRFGRLYMEPRYGSERLPMTVPLRAEYFDGTVFVANVADACTTLVTGNVTLTPLGGQVHAVTSAGNGRWNVTLSAPNVSGQAGLSIDLAAPGATVPYPSLTADTNRDGIYAEDPATTLTFGLRTQEDRRIYQREVVGN